MRKIYGMYFSGTDTTKKIVEFLADRLSQYLQGEKRIYDFTLPAARKGYPEFTEDDIVVFGTPVIAGRVPNVLLPYLRTIRGNQAAAVPATRARQRPAAATPWGSRRVILPHSHTGSTNASGKKVMKIWK